MVRVVALVFYVGGSLLLMRTVTQALARQGLSALSEPVSAMALAIVFWGIVLWVLFDVLPSRRRIAAMQRELSVLASSGRELDHARDPLLRALGDTLASLARARDDLERTERLAQLGYFAGGVAHQFGNPLSAARQYVEVLRAMPLSEDAARIVARIDAQLERLHRAVEGLLRFAQPDRLTPARVDVVALLRTIIADSALLAGAEVELPQEPVWVYTDAAALEQVLTNLLRNAVEAQAHAKAQARVRVTIGKNDPWVEVGIHDYGPGFAVQDAAHTPLRSGKPHGTGLGLPLARRLTEILGGRLEVLNRSDGASVTLALPVGGTQDFMSRSQTTVDSERLGP